MTLRTWPLDAEGNYRSDEPGRVTFEFEHIRAVDLVDFHPQSVVDVLKVERCERGFLMSIEAAFGLQGTIEAEGVAVRFQQQEPSI
ncbi:hypothetical protein [Phenylobacterium sp. Root700]|uniref:hypothetical protein n=1 Tax=Phenylobacterium sp. Root700 TaxID=1736591 RepID=UPI0012E38EAD|nr:hypothetical protein [Phenylobacterium sp. Root700]